MKNLRFLNFSLLIVLCWLLVPGRLAAQTEELVFRSEADYAFGQVMTFRLTAEHEIPIQSATLFFRTPEFPNAFSVNVPIVNGNIVNGNIESGTTVVAEYTVDLAQVRLAPFTTVTYWWLLATSDGQDIAIPQQTFLYEDDQFDWRQLSQDGATVHWTGEDAAVGQLALDIVEEAKPRLEAFIPVTEEAPFQLYIYPTSADLRAALRLTGRDWVGAHAAPELGVILVTAVNARTAATDLRQSIPHEMVHFFLYQATSSSYGTLPLWFNEGLATYMETLPNPSYERGLETAVTRQNTIPFAQLCQSFPAVEDRALLAYAQSVSLVQYIQAQYGNQALSELVQAFADGADCQTGVNRVLSRSLAELEQAWLRSQQLRSPLVQFFFENGFWLLLLVGGLGITRLLILNPNEAGIGRLRNGD